MGEKDKEIFGEGDEEEEEDEEGEEEEQGQVPMELTQGQGEDQEEDAEGSKGEEDEEAQKNTKAKKRNAKEQIVEKPKKPMKKPQQKPIVPTTRSSTRETTIQEREFLKPKGKRTPEIVEMSEPTKKTYKRLKNKLVPQLDLDEEKIELDDLSQFKVVSHNPSSNLDNLCDNINSNVDLSSFTHIEFDKLGEAYQNKVEEAIYEMMATFKSTPLEIANSLPKILYD